MYYSEKSIMTAFKTLLKNVVYTKVYAAAFDKIRDRCDEETKLLLDRNYTLTDDFYEYTGTDEVADIIFGRYSDWWFGYPEGNSDIMFSLNFTTFSDNGENSRITSRADLHIFVGRGNYLEGIWLAKTVKSLNIHESDGNRVFDGCVITSLKSQGGMSADPDNYFFVNVNNGSYYPFKITYNITYGGY